jgi:hypothetical protein
VLPKPTSPTAPPPAPPPRANRPPANVTGVALKSADGKVTLTWTNPSDADFDRTEITRTPTKAGSTGTLVYREKGTSYTDRGLSNGVEYRYVLVTVDKAGNSSAGVATVAMPKANLLRLPADGARLTKIPKQFRWTPDPRATHYNLQLYSGGALVAQSTASAGEKILSVFPTKPFYKQVQEPLEVERAHAQDDEGSLHLVRLARLWRPREDRVRSPHGLGDLPADCDEVALGARHPDERARQAGERKDRQR